MTQRKELAARRRFAPEPALRQKPVDHDERRIGEREPVGPEAKRHRSRCEECDDQRDPEDNVLPGRDDVKGGSVDTGAEEQRHHKVVEHEPACEHEQCDPGQALAHAIATSVIPRL